MKSAKISYQTSASEGFFLQILQQTSSKELPPKTSVTNNFATDMNTSTKFAFQDAAHEDFSINFIRNFLQRILAKNFCQQEFVSRIWTYL